MRAGPCASVSVPARCNPSPRPTLKTWWTGCSPLAAGAAVRQAPHSVRLTLGRLKAAFEMAVDEGKLVRNVVRLVKPPEYTPGEREVWSRTEVRKFLRTAANDRLHAAWRLSLYGLRRGEVLGVRWSDINLKARTLTVRQARVLVDYKVHIEEPKSRNGKRTLPMDDALVAALTDLRKRQAKESEAAGTAYRAGLTELDWYTEGDEYVVT